MSKKYEREIEEILRNMDHNGTQAGYGPTVDKRFRRQPRPRSFISLPNFSFSEWCLILAVILALFAGGWAYAHNFTGSLMTGVIALMSLVLIFLVALSNYIERPRPLYPTTGRYNNPTPIQRNPLRRLGTSWHLWNLKRKYRNLNAKDPEDQD
jgi:hypothetical protein